MNRISRGTAVALLYCAGACAGEPPAPRERAADSSTLPARAAACRAPAAQLFIDHVIVAVADLSAAVDSARGAGFTVKPGRLHADGLLNAHVKFPSAQEIELMALVGPPASTIAAEYERILSDGEGGAYLALAVPDLDSVARVASASGLHPERPSSGAAGFVSFPADSAAMAVFFGGRSSVIDPDSVLTHANGARALAEARVEGGDALVDVLLGLGAVICDTGEAARARRLGVSNGEIVVVPRSPGRRARLLSGRLEGVAEELVWFDRRRE